MNDSIYTLHNKFILFFATMGLFFGLVVNQTIYSPALYSLMVIVVFVIFLSFYRFSVKLKPLQFILLLMLISFIIKIFSVFIFEGLMLNAIGIPFLSYNDDYVYDVVSSKILSTWQIRGFGFYKDITYSTGFYSGYPNLSAIAKALLGDHHLVPRFLNVFFSTLTVPLYFATVRYLSNSDKTTKLITILFALAPAFIVYSSLQLKDTILIFFVAALIYGTVNFFYKGFNTKNVLIVAFAMSGLIFFRAAILLPYLVAIIISSLIVKRDTSNKLKSFLWISLVILCFYFIWAYFYSTGLLSLTGEEYFESRFLLRNQAESYQGTNDLGKLGIVAILLGPLLAVLSLFLPAPIYVELDQFVATVPYHYLPLMGYYAILPMVSVSLIYLLKQYRLNKIGIFIVTFLILYKLGQAGDKSILDSRQSLPAIYLAYLLLAYFDLKNKDIEALWKRYRFIIISTILVVFFSVTFLRYMMRL